MLKRFEIIVKGEVQRAAFRQFVKWLAKKHGLYGKVENLRNYDEDVFIVLEGKEQRIRKFLQRLSNPNRGDKARTAAKITKIVPKGLPYSGEFKDKEFEIVSRGNELQERLDEGVLLLKHLSKEMGGLRGEVKSGFGKMSGEIGGLRSETKSGFGKMSGSTNKNFKSLGGKIDRNFRALGDRTDENSQSLGNKIDRNFGSLGGKIDKNFGCLGRKTDRGFGGLGNKMDKNFGSLDRKYGSISGILVKINGNLERLVGKQ